MIIANREMFQILFETKKKNKVELNKNLVQILDDGLVLIEGCVLLNYFYSSNLHLSRDQFEDSTGFECFINGFHIDDYCSSNYLVNAITFSNNFIDVWEKQIGQIPLEIVISRTEFGFHFRAHTIRNSEIWLNEKEIDIFEDPVLIIKILFNPISKKP